jgi:hypothetical protein
MKPQRFLAAHYLDLQGLRLAPLWLLGLMTPWLASHGHPARNVAMLFLTILFAYVGNLMIGRYYASRFGRIKPKVQSSGPGKLILALIPGALLAYSFVVRGTLKIPAAYPSILFGCLLAVQVIARDNPLVRRIYSGAGMIACFSAAIGVAMNGSIFTLRVMACLIFSAMLAVGIFDHLLLVHLVSRAREEANA